jgi:hypothetical protein
MVVGVDSNKGERTSRGVNSLLNSCLYPSSANRASSACLTAALRDRVFTTISLKWRKIRLRKSAGMARGAPNQDEVPAFKLYRVPMGIIERIQ